WDFNYGNLFGKSTMNEILEALDKEYIEGFSILGGEPFENENKETVYNVIRTVKEKFPQKTIWCYSGFCFEELAESSRNILELIDVLVDGAFVEGKKNLRLKFRGSENQRIIDVKKSLEKGETVEFEI
ncbi:MAG: 4Fe-4S single cluster domain-containing protein, partial [Clostridia bacterium]|nr:4Fe-4S single cluster domain-containing protein [Clostridia bacterium]